MRFEKQFLNFADPTVFFLLLAVVQAAGNFEAIVKHLFDYLDGQVTEGGAVAEWMMQKKRNGNQQITGLVDHP